MTKRCFLGAAVGVLCLFLAAGFAFQVLAQQGDKKPWEVWDYAKTGKPVRGGYYRTASANDVGLLNPNHWPVQDWLVINYFFEKLLITDGSYRPVPWMVEGWEYPDPLTCILKLKKGIAFHDGAPFNAQAVKYQIDWIMDKKNGCWSRGWITPVKSVEVVDEHTVKWHFKKPWAGFLGIIANVPGYMISPNALKADVAMREAKVWENKAKKAAEKADKAEAKAKELAAKGGEAAKKAEARARKARKKASEAAAKAKAYAEQAKGRQKTDNYPVGTGKWILEDRSPGNWIKVKRNPNWWFGKSIGHPDMPYYDGRLNMVIPDPSVRLANLRAGKIHSMTLDKSQYDMVKKDPNLNVYIGPVNHVRAISFNHAKGPCRDIRVRKAISHAIDRKALIVGTQFGLGRIASCMYPEDHWCHNPDLKPVAYDPELSKKLLAEAGFKKGLELKGYIANDPWSQTLGEAIKAMLAEVGIQWKVDMLDAAARSDRLKNLEFDIAQGGWTWIYDPDLMASGLYHPDGGFNYGRSKNDKAIELIEAGRVEVDFDKRTKIYWELEKVLYDNYEDAWLFWEMWPTAYSKKVMGYNHDMIVKHKEIWAWSHPTWFKDGKP